MLEKTDALIQPLRWKSPIIGHRGAAALAPENTLASLIKTRELGVDWIEFDVMLTADDEPVVIHDPTLRRTTNGSGRVSSKTFLEIHTLDAGSWFDSAYAGEKILHLNDYLKFAQRHALNVNVELKPVARHEKLAAEKTLIALQENYTDSQLQMIISSFSLSILTQLRALDKTINLGLLIPHWNAAAAKAAKRLNCRSIHIHENSLTIWIVQEIKQQGYQLLAYTVNDYQRAQQLLEWGVDAIFSDLPETMHSLITS
jgi:glycerophosphoryl diester phosphodiesterase